MNLIEVAKLGGCVGCHIEANPPPGGLFSVVFICGFLVGSTLNEEEATNLRASLCPEHAKFYYTMSGARK